MTYKQALARAAQLFEQIDPGHGSRQLAIALLADAAENAGQWVIHWIDNDGHGVKARRDPWSDSWEVETCS